LARVRALRALLRSISTTDGRASKTLDRDGATATLLVGIDHRTAIDLVRDWHHIVGPYQTGMPSLSAAELVKKDLCAMSSAGAGKLDWLFTLMIPDAASS
jgi:hypothetical protein